MALNNLGLGLVFTARDLASAKLQRLERRFSSLDERVIGGTDRMTSAFRQLGVGLAIFTAGAAAVGAVTRATTRELGLLREAAINAGIETQFSPTEAVVGTLNAYGMNADQAAGVTDRLLRITQLTNFQTRDFEAGLAKAAATGAVFNQGLNDVLITMGLLRNRNIEASSAATAFR